MKSRLAFLTLVALLAASILCACGPQPPVPPDPSVHLYTGTVVDYTVTYTSVTVDLNAVSIDGTRILLQSGGTLGLTLARNINSEAIRIGDTVSASCWAYKENLNYNQGSCQLMSVSGK